MTNMPARRSTGCVCGLAALLTLGGCSHFHVHPKGSQEELRLTSVWSGHGIPVYWSNPQQFLFPKPTLPDRKYAVVGYVSGEADVVFQGIQWEGIEASFRRGAAALEGDAVVDAHMLHFFGPVLIAAFQGKVVKWESKQDSEPRPWNGKCPETQPAGAGSACSSNPLSTATKGHTELLLP